MASAVEIKLALWLMKFVNYFGKRFKTKISLSNFIHRSIVWFELVLIDDSFLRGQRVQYASRVQPIDLPGALVGMSSGNFLIESGPETTTHY